MEEDVAPPLHSSLKFFSKTIQSPESSFSLQYCDPVETNACPLTVDWLWRTAELTHLIGKQQKEYIWIKLCDFLLAVGSAPCTKKGCCAESCIHACHCFASYTAAADFLGYKKCQKLPICYVICGGTFCLENN